MESYTNLKTYRFKDIKNVIFKSMRQGAHFIVADERYWPYLVKLNKSILIADRLLMKSTQTKEWIARCINNNEIILTSLLILNGSDFNVLSTSKAPNLIIVDKRILPNPAAQKKIAEHATKLPPIKSQYVYVPVNLRIFEMIDKNPNFELKMKINQIYPIWLTNARKYDKKKLSLITITNTGKIFTFKNQDGGRGGQTKITEKEILFRINISELHNNIQNVRKEEKNDSQLVETVKQISLLDTKLGNDIKKLGSKLLKSGKSYLNSIKNPVANSQENTNTTKELYKDDVQLIEKVKQISLFDQLEEIREMSDDKLREEHSEKCFKHDKFNDDTKFMERTNEMYNALKKFEPKQNKRKKVKPTHKKKRKYRDSPQKSRVNQTRKIEQNTQKEKDSKYYNYDSNCQSIHVSSDT